MLVVGLMSGTSVDAVDVALVEISERRALLRVEQQGFQKSAFDRRLRERVFKAFEAASAPELSALNVALGEAFAAAVLSALDSWGVAADAVDLVSSHGQTIWHGPNGPEPSTLQIGEPSVIAERTGITTVADFRPRDVAAGGQGAPLVSLVDFLLFSDRRATRAVQNIGGIGNVTIIPAGAAPEDVTAFDTGPGNMLLDCAARELTAGALDRDVDGRLAAVGRANEPLLEELLAHPFLARRPPKTCGREEFGKPFCEQVLARSRAIGLSKEDVLATLTAFTAESIAAAYAAFSPRPIDEAILGGGGSYNPTLVAMLERRLAPTRVLVLEQLGMSGDAKEAVAFAVLGYLGIHGRPNNLPACTGARRSVPMGKIVPGANYARLLRQLSRSHATLYALGT